jgi:hypothetical protein
MSSPRLVATFALLAVLDASLPAARAADAAFDPVATLDSYNTEWTDPGQSSRDSMPLGNGDTSLNVWTEPSGDLLFYIGKSDAWTENPADKAGLAKLGRIHVTLTPNSFAAGKRFSQTLRLHSGEIVVIEGDPNHAAMFRVWVDANNSAIHVEVKTSDPTTVKTALEVWRTQPDGGLSADTILPDQKDQVVWYHHNDDKSKAAVKNWTFGGVMEGTNFSTVDPQTLQSAKPATEQAFAIYPLTTPASTPEAWVAAAQAQATKLAALDLEKARAAHARWWDEFWNRSWIFMDGEAKAHETTEGYVLQRFVTACAGRGAYPIKFNGSIFVVDHPAESMGGKPPVTKPVTADFRAWGGQYWFQNTRAMYWPRLAAGDFDIMRPLFKMYLDQLPANAALVKQYYHHDGVYCAETAAFWGGFGDLTNNGKGSYTANYFTDLLELSMMGLDYYEYTGDSEFLKTTVLPLANGITTFFDQHFPHDPASGKLVLDPDNAIEMYWKVHNPAPDIAGLHAVLTRLIALPADLADDAQKKTWQRELDELPDLPKGQVGDKTVLLPYEGEQTQPSHNSENPELYAIFPYRLYGTGRPDFQVAVDTFNARRNKTTGCWVQDPVQAAMVGLTDLAQKNVTINLTRRDPDERFPAFWVRGHDYMPDEDNGGMGELGLQNMLLQNNGRQILLLPAWPANWNANFKLRAPFQTTVEGRVEAGKLVRLVVTPPERKQDVVLPAGVTMP